MTGDHSRKLTEFKPDELRVHFSPELKRNFARLEAAVCDSEHFDSGILRTLQDLAEGKATTVRSTILGIAAVIQETGNHIRATDDAKTEELLSAIIDGMVPVKDGPEPMTVASTRAKTTRGS